METVTLNRGFASIYMKHTLDVTRIPLKAFLIKTTVIIHLFTTVFLQAACSKSPDTCGCTRDEYSGQGEGSSEKKDNGTDEKSNTFGIDISHHNGDIDWKLLSSRQNLDFVYIKATEGATHIDQRYFKNVEGAYAAGYPIGSYHFFRMKSSAHEQFKNFDKAIKQAGKQSLIPMVDVETDDHHPIKELRDSLKVFMSLIKEEYGVYPMIYGTKRSYSELCGSAFNKYHLYIGRYGNKPPSIKGKGHYTIWQYSEKGILPGIPKPVDMAKFHPKYGIRDISLSLKDKR